jgi:hypothetical protein
MGIPASLPNYFNAMTTLLYEECNSGSLEIDMEIRCDQQQSFT